MRVKDVISQENSVITEKEVMFRSFRKQEDDQLARSSVLLAKVFYMLDHKVRVIHFNISVNVVASRVQTRMRA